MTRFSLWRALTNNWGYKLVAVIFALFIWSWVITDIDPVRVKTYNAPVACVGLDILKDNGLMISESVGETASVRTAVPLSDLRRSTANRVRVEVDVSEITEAGTYTLPLRASAAYGTPASGGISPNHISVTVERYTSKVVSLNWLAADISDQDLWSAKPDSALKRVTVWGPETLVSRVSMATVQLGAPDIVGETYAKDYPISLTDAENQPLQDTVLTCSATTVTVEQTFYHIKEVPLLLSNVIQGVPGHGDDYSLGEPECRPATVRIAGPDNLLAQYSSIGIMPIDVTGLKATFTQDVSLLVPNDVVWSDYTTVSLYVPIHPIIITRTFSNLRVVLVTESGETPLSDTALDVTISGPKELVDAMSASDIRLAADARGKAPGLQTLDVHCEFLTPLEGVIGTPAQNELRVDVP